MRKPSRSPFFTRLTKFVFPLLDVLFFANSSKNGGPDMNVAFLGIGLMGGPMARRLLKAKYPVVAYNRSR